MKPLKNLSDDMGMMLRKQVGLDTCHWIVSNDGKGVFCKWILCNIPASEI